MNGYVIAIITISIVGGITSSLISTNDARLKKHLNFLTSLIFLIVLLSPIKNAVNKVNLLKENIDSFVSSISSNVDYSNKLIINSSIDNICSGIKNAITNEFKLKKDDIEIRIDVNSTNVEAVQIETIKIFLYNEATWYDESKIKDFVENLVGCEVTIKKV